MRALTDHETETTDLFLELIADMPKDDAALAALSVLPERWIETDFVHWLSEGTLTRDGKHILRTKHLDNDNNPLTWDY
jgi:hypothetical protein